MWYTYFLESLVFIETILLTIAYTLIKHSDKNISSSSSLLFIQSPTLTDSPPSILVSISPAPPKKKRSRYIPIKIRKALLTEQDYCCALCQIDLRTQHMIYDVDHIKPFALGGSNEQKNLRILCTLCHALRTRKGQE